MKKLRLLIKYIVLFLLPFLRLVPVIIGLKKSYRISHNQYFRGAIFRHYIILGLTLISFSFIILMTYNIISYDKNFYQRYSFYQKKHSHIIDIPNNIKYSIIRLKTDSKKTLKEKRETQARLLALFILVIPALFFYFFIVSIFIFLHPSISARKKLIKSLIRTGIIKKDDSYYIFASPIGFLIRIEGLAPEDLIAPSSSKIWAPLNVKVSKFIEDDNDRSLIFYKKSFELPSLIDYNK